MSNVHDNRPTTPIEHPLDVILEEIRKLGVRVENLEQHSKTLNVPEIPHVPLPPSLALRSDGKVLVALAHLEGADILERERWEGVVLSIAETADVLNAMSNAADDAAAHTAGRILWHRMQSEDDLNQGISNEQR